MWKLPKQTGDDSDPFSRRRRQARDRRREPERLRARRQPHSPSPLNPAPEPDPPNPRLAEHSEPKPASAFLNLVLQPNPPDPRPAQNFEPRAPPSAPVFPLPANQQRSSTQLTTPGPAPANWGGYSQFNSSGKDFLPPQQAQGYHYRTPYPPVTNPYLPVFHQAPSQFHQAPSQYPIYTPRTNPYLPTFHQAPTRVPNHPPPPHSAYARRIPAASYGPQQTVLGQGPVQERRPVPGQLQQPVVSERNPLLTYTPPSRITSL